MHVPLLIKQALSRTACLLLILPTLALASQPAALSADDIAWLRRDGFDLDAANLKRLHSLGRQGLLEAQLADRINDPLPAPINDLLRSYPALTTPAAELLQNYKERQEQLKALPDGDAKIAARKADQQQANALAEQARAGVLLHAIYGPNQLKEQLVVFWLNHFSVFQGKGQVRILSADYVENAIRPHALGRFQDLLLATLKSPAMLQYLDNAQNAKGKVNENYARELMELHTLGVGAGYSQQDVQQLALILTGAGLTPLDGRPQNFPPRLQALRVQQGLFQFNPRRHDFSDKLLLGQPVKGRGFDEITQAVELITRQPACARFISQRLRPTALAGSWQPRADCRTGPQRHRHPRLAAASAGGSGAGRGTLG